MNTYRTRLWSPVLLLLALCLVCAPVGAQSADETPTPGQWGDVTTIDQFRAWNIDDYEAESGQKIETFHQSPSLDELVSSGKLPPVEQRLPDRSDIQVEQPRDAIGTYGGTIRYNATNPLTFGNVGWSAWDQQLAAFSTNWEVIYPNIAKSIVMSDDNKVATISLRKGMKWSDGVPLTADDIMFWYTNTQNADLPKMPAGLVVGGKAPVVAKVDDFTVTFTFEVPFPAFIEVVARGDAGFPIAPKHYLQKWHADLNPDAQKVAEAEGFKTWAEAFESHRAGQLVDTQTDVNLPVLKPWVLDSIDQFGNKLYKRNPYYWIVDTQGNQLPYLDGQTRMLIGDLEVVKLNIQSGDLDYADKMVIKDLPVLRAGEAQGNYTTLLFPSDQGTTRKYQFNLTVDEPVLREIFNDIRFREAMSLAINRQEINDTLFFGLGIPRQWGVSSHSPFYEDWMSDYFAAYDVDQANKLLDDMGLKKGGDGMRLRSDGQPLKIVLWDAIDNVPMDELVVEYWKAVGVDTEINTSTREALTQALVANQVQASVWFADVVAAIDMHTRPIWFRPPYGLDTTPLGGGLAWRQWWLSGKTEGTEPPDPYYTQQMELADKFQLTAIGSPEYKELGKQLVESTEKQMVQIGTVGEVPYIYVRSNRLKNFPSESTVYIDHLRGGHSDTWYLGG